MITFPYAWLVSLNKGHFDFEPPTNDPVVDARRDFNEGEDVWNQYFSAPVDVSDREVLDLGCGTGGKTCFLATLKPKKVVGVDFSPDVVHLAELATPVLLPPGERTHVEFACVDASDMPWPDGYFDLVV